MAEGKLISKRREKEENKEAFQVRIKLWNVVRIIQTAKPNLNP